MTRRVISPAIAAGAVAWTAAAVMSARGQTGVRPRSDPGLTPRVDFERQVQPIIADRCLECHSQDKRKGGLSLATYADALDGGRNGPAIRPGNGARSLLIHRITGAVEPQMPKDKDPLTPAEVALVRRWIDQGARATSSSAPAPQPWEAPLPLTRPATPAILWTRWAAPLDRFVAKYLVAQKTAEPAPVSDALFVRRVYLDVWGLLPTPDDLQRFVDDRTPGKRASLIATLLADD